MPAPVPYSSFITQNGAAVDLGGPWTVSSSSSEFQCLSLTLRDICNDVPHCLSCLAIIDATELSYSVKFEANVSIPTNLIGSSNSISYDWSYTAALGSSKKPRGTILSINSYVGDTSYTDTFASDDMDELISTRQTWINGLFTHSGSTLVAQYGDPTVGYVSIVIDFTFPREANSSVDYFMKRASFKITSSPVSAPSSSTFTNSNTVTLISSQINTSSVSGTGISMQTSSQVFSRTPIFSVASDGHTYTIIESPSIGGSLNPGSHLSKRTPVIVASVVGTLSILCILLVLCRLYSKRKRHRKSLRFSMSMENDIPLVSPWTKRPPEPEITKQPNFPYSEASIASRDDEHPAFTPPVSEPSPQGPNHNANPRRPLSDNVTAFASEAPPPAYSSIHSPTETSNDADIHSPVSPSDSRMDPLGDWELSRWAHENRAYITPRLKAKLVAARYLPTTNPDSITEEEWERRWGVTKLELTRMRMLYSRSDG
ncbi:hypothetical protein FRB91_011646 [Serendipita sp. 411]|nr:hypothetical protein FRB91_011646 [Serendipita sp. 411]